MNCEIEFLPVGDGSRPGDAIVVRYGFEQSYELMVIDGGTLASGKELVNHIQAVFGHDAVVSHAVVTHSDADHASGMSEVLTSLNVKNLWLHLPWKCAAESRPYFADKSKTEQELALELRKEFDILDDLVTIASTRGIRIEQPFAGANIGPFRVVSPYKELYASFVPQFDRTPAPDEVALKQKQRWIGKPPGLLGSLLDKMAAKAQKWVPETWESERLKDGGITSASNETSVVLFGDFGPGRRVLLTGDAGVWGLSMAHHFMSQNALPLQDFMFIQIPHHGSRRNIGPSMLNNFLGNIRPKNTVPRCFAYVSAPKDDDTHPRGMVLNAFIRRGCKIGATQGEKVVFWGGFAPRSGYGPLRELPFADTVEDYD